MDEHSYSKDYYAALRCTQSDDVSVLKRAWTFRMAQLNPRINRSSPDSEATREAQEVNEAWEVLSDPDRRAHYDAWYSEVRASSRPADSHEATGKREDSRRSDETASGSSGGPGRPGGGGPSGDHGWTKAEPDRPVATLRPSRRRFVVGGIGVLVLLGIGSAINSALNGKRGSSTAPPVSQGASNTTPARAGETAVETKAAQSTATAAPTAPRTYAPGTVLYAADWSSGDGGWKLPNGWAVVAGALRTDGTRDEVVAAPFRPDTLDYAVECEVEPLELTQFFTLTVRGIYRAGLDGHRSVGIRTSGKAGAEAFDGFYTPPVTGPTFKLRFEAKGKLLALHVNGLKAIDAVSRNDDEPGFGGIASFGKARFISFRIVST